jgi:putative ABC transport system permease protein
MPILTLAIKSLWSRRGTALLTIGSLAVSVMLLLGVEKVKREARNSFTSTISGTDLIVGARSGGVQLLLYSVFRIGNAANNISIDSYSRIAAFPETAWTIPLSLGDSHRGFRVLGTTVDYFTHYRYARKRSLSFRAGRQFEDIFDAVLGADVAETLGYQIGDPIVVNHGIGAVGFAPHKDKPFRVAGILARTGTPVDRTVHVSLQGIEAIHVDWRDGRKVRGLKITADDVRKMNLEPKAVTAVLVGLNTRLAAFAVQRRINEYRGEPLLAILPGVTLQELWTLVGTAETGLAAVSLLVVIASLLGMLTMLLAGLSERRREMAILRAVGARPRHVMGLLVAESTLLVCVGTICGLALFYLGLVVTQPVIETRFGLHVALAWPTARDGAILAFVIAAGIAAGLIPAYRAYKRTLTDGLTVRS